MILLNDLETEDRPFFTGHEFILESKDERGWNVIDDNGNRVEGITGKWFVIKADGNTDPTLTNL